MNILDKLLQIKENESKIYESGYNKGFAEGKVEGDGGIDTSDATATANDILYPCTAYVDGEKIEGNIMPKYESDIVVTEIAATIPPGYYPEEMRIVFPGDDPASLHNAINIVLDLQEKYMKETVFYLDYTQGNSDNLVFNFDEGTTWEQWCGSAYNTDQVFSINDRGDVMYYGVSYVRDSNNEWQKNNTPIKRDETYYC